VVLTTENVTGSKGGAAEGDDGAVGSGEGDRGWQANLAGMLPGDVEGALVV